MDGKEVSMTPPHCSDQCYIGVCVCPSVSAVCVDACVSAFTTATDNVNAMKDTVRYVA